MRLNPKPVYETGKEPLNPDELRPLQQESRFPAVQDSSTRFRLRVAVWVLDLGSTGFRCTFAECRVVPEASILTVGFQWNPKPQTLPMPVGLRIWDLGIGAAE